MDVMQQLVAALAVLVSLAFAYLRSSLHSRPTRTIPAIQIVDSDFARRMVIDHADFFSNHPRVPVPVDLDAGERRTHSITSMPYGLHWRVLRSNLTANIIHPTRLGHVFPLLQRDAIDALVADLSAARSGAAGEGAVVAVRDGLYDAVFATMARLCFGDGVGERDVRAMQRTLREFFHSRMDAKLLARSRLARLLHWRQWRHLVGTRGRLAEVFGPVVAAVARQHSRRSSNGGGGVCSYVDSLLDLRIPNYDGDAEPAGSQCLDAQARRALRDDELVRLVWELLAASVDTVVTSLEWTLAHLVADPGVQKKLYLELTRDQRKGQAAEAARLRDSPYLRAVILESLRLHPPLPKIVREVGPEGAAVAGTSPPADATVTHFLFMIEEFGRDPKAWTDPDEFRPERFLAGGEGEDVSLDPGHKQIKMMPFGAGRRLCPGSGLAMMHIGSIISRLMCEFEWLPPADGGGVDLTPINSLIGKLMASPLTARIMPRMSNS